MKYWREPLDLREIRAPHGVLHLLKERCKGCGFCVEFCPKHVLKESDEVNSKGYVLPAIVAAGDCLSCGLCELLCPECAIYTVEEMQEVASLWEHRVS